MLAKKYRLPIQVVIGKRGQSYKSRYFLLKIFANSLAFNRFGAVISKKVAPRAVDRNKLKRQIFNFFKNNSLPVQNPNQNKDLLIIAFPGILSVEKKDFISDLGKLFF